MARKKISKKDLGKGVARLKKKLETMTSRLKKQKSDLSRTLSSLQKQVEELRKNDALSTRLAAQANNQQDLALTTEGLAAKLRDLEETTSRVERAAGELKERTDALERSAAEINTWQQGCTQLTRRLDDQSGVLPGMKERLDRLTLDLNKLWANTDGLGVSLGQQTDIVTLLGKSKAELADRMGGLENELRTRSEQQLRNGDQISQPPLQTGDSADLLERLDGLSSRHREQAQLVASYDSRLHGLEQASSLLERFGDELGRRTESLEANAVEAKRDRDELLRRTLDLEDRLQALPLVQEQVKDLHSQLLILPDTAGQGENGLGPLVHALGDRTQAVEEQLRRLLDAQENLELQTALLSRQAEEDGLTPQTFAAFSDDRSESAQPADELAAQVRELQKGVLQQTRDSAELAEHYQRLEAAGAKLSQIQQALLDRVGRIEQRAVEPGQGGAAPEQPQVVPKLLDRCSMTEEATARLNRRTAVLEAKSESLARQDALLSSQLEAAQQRLSELQEQPRRATPLLTQGSAATRPEGSLESLEQQLISLTADQSVNHSHLEEFLTRTEALEAAAAGHTEQTDTLSSRVTALADELQGLLTLGVGQRLDDLDFRGEGLERSLQEERGRIDELQQSGGALGERLSAVADGAEVLEGLVNTLDSGSKRLDSELERLGGAVEAADKRVQQQQQHLEEGLSAHSKTVDGLNDRLTTLADAQQALKKTTASLGVQQTRQNSENQNLRQGLKQRSMLGMLMLLLIAAAVGFMLMRGPVIPAAPQQVMQPVAPVQPVPAAATPAVAFEKEMSGMRQELSRLGDSLSQVNDSVERIDAVTFPELPAQVSGLAQSLDTLNGENLRQQEENARLLAAQEKLRVEMETLSGTVKSLEKQVDAYPAVELATKAVRGQEWARAQQLGRYTVQVVGVRKRTSLARFIEQHGLEDTVAIYRTGYRGGYWYVLFHGIYDSIEQAQAAVRLLPAELAVDGPWVRRIPESGDLLPP